MIKSFLFFLDFLYQSIIGFVSVSKKIFLFILDLYYNVHLFEKIYILVSIMTGAMLTQGWRSYKIMFGPDTGRHHHIYTDDFLWFFIFLIISLVPSLLIALEISIKNKKISFFVFRITGLSGMSILYYLNFISPQRMAPVTEADFTWQFYSISICLVISWISGFMGLKNQAHKS